MSYLVTRLLGPWCNHGKIVSGFDCLSNHRDDTILKSFPESLICETVDYNVAKVTNPFDFPLHHNRQLAIEVVVSVKVIPGIGHNKFRDHIHGTDSENLNSRTSSSNCCHGIAIYVSFRLFAGPSASLLRPGAAILAHLQLPMHRRRNLHTSIDFAVPLACALSFGFFEWRRGSWAANEDLYLQFYSGCASQWEAGEHPVGNVLGVPLGRMAQAMQKAEALIHLSRDHPSGDHFQRRALRLCVEFAWRLRTMRQPKRVLSVSMNFGAYKKLSLRREQLAASLDGANQIRVCLLSSSRKPAWARAPPARSIKGSVSFHIRYSPPLCSLAHAYSTWFELGVRLQLM
ncbi:hypothetical protein EDB86DRAFT_2837134 [Lactarius hatsudake]|nr:hypothetical protein EDB86DRAFT_2837134 [Lactarius hatsudake]